MRPRWPLSGRWLLRGQDACGSRCGFRCCWLLPRGLCMWAIASSTLLPDCASLHSNRCASATGFIGVTGAHFCPWPLPRLASLRESSSPLCRPWPARATRYWRPRLWFISPACTQAATRGNSRSGGRIPFPARNSWWASCLPRGACCLCGIGLTLSPRRVPRFGSSGFLPLPSPLWPGSIAVALRGGREWKDLHIATIVRQYSMRSIALALFTIDLLLCVLAAASAHPRPAALLAAGATSALLLALLDRNRARFSALALRAAADLVLLTPLALIPFAWASQMNASSLSTALVQNPKARSATEFQRRGAALSVDGACYFRPVAAALPLRISRRTRRMPARRRPGGRRRPLHGATAPRKSHDRNRCGRCERRHVAHAPPPRRA